MIDIEKLRVAAHSREGQRANIDGPLLGDLLDELEGARETIAEQSGLISRQGIEIMNQLEEIASQDEELAILLKVRAWANKLDDCLNEFGEDGAKACSECAQYLHDALYDSRHIEPKLLGFFTEEPKHD